MKHKLPTAQPAISHGSGDILLQQKVRSLDAPRQSCLVAHKTPHRISTLVVAPEGNVADDFVLQEQGLFWQRPDKAEPKFVCSYLKLLALGRNEAGQEWCLLLEVKDPDGKLHEVFLPMRLLAGEGREYRAELRSRGLRLARGRKSNSLLDRYLNAPSKRRVRTVMRAGWHGERFVLPNRVFGEGGSMELVRLQQTLDNPASYAKAGSLAEWQQLVAAPCVGNSRLTFAISCALAAPLLRIAGQEGGGFHFRGVSSSGKTTALAVAGSVSGGGGGKPNINTWRATDNALESTAAAHCDGLLLLDELGQVDSKVVGNVAYMLSNGAGKRRSSADGIVRLPLEWILLYLSTGELSLRDKMAEAGLRRRTGQELRMVEIAADAGSGLGLFENLHGSASPQAFACRLREASIACYGSLLPTYLDYLVANLEELTEWLREIVEKKVTRLIPLKASGQVARTARRFALVGAAGSIATKLGLLPWPEGEASKSATICFNSWLAGRGTLGCSESAEHIQAVKRFVEAHGSSRFEELGGATLAAKTTKRVGWRCKDAEGNWEHWILPEAFKWEVCAGLDARSEAADLIEAGLLQPDKEGKAAQLKSISNYRRQRVYCLSALIFTQ